MDIVGPCFEGMMKHSELRPSSALDLSVDCPRLTPAASAFPAAGTYFKNYICYQCKVYSILFLNLSLLNTSAAINPYRVKSKLMQQE
jgi:hypothetical protein